MFFFTMDKKRDRRTGFVDKLICTRIANHYSSDSWLVCACVGMGPEKSMFESRSRFFSI
jgi:hypothetical protein